MKTSILLLLFTSLNFIAFSQTKSYKSSTTIVEKKEFKTESVERTLFLTENSITISNYLNGGKDDAKMKINKIEKKEYSLDGVCNWYYCTSTVKDPIIGYSKFIIIIPEHATSVYIFHFADEVSVYSSQLLINPY